ncbi:MAG: NAD-dependent epimerase/dehydratase family protein [Paracoccaceae bacterium]
MTIAIIGGTGFLGRHICEALASTDQTAVVLSHRPDYGFLSDLGPQITAAEIDTDEAREHLQAADAVLHLGHRSRPASNVRAEIEEVRQNIEPAIGLLSLLAAGQRCPRFIYTSSGGQIYGAGHTQPILESSPASPVTPYALGKHLIEQALWYFHSQGAVRATVLRLANPVGRWQLGGRHGFVTAAIEALLLDKPLTLYGSGSNMRDYFDAEEFGILAAELVRNTELPTGTFNVGSGSGLTELDVLAEIRETLGAVPALEYKPARMFDLPFAVLDVTAARTELGWKSHVHFNETVQKISRVVQARSDG